MNASTDLAVNHTDFPTTKRNHGIDLLRVIATVMIVTLHILSQGGVLKALGDFTLKGEVMWFFQVACYGAVNIFAIISGYVGLNSKHKLSSLILLWFQVVFYTVISEVIIAVLFEDGYAVMSVLKGFLPVFSEQNWYFSAYFIVFLFIPLLNEVVEKVTKKVLDRALIVAVVFFVILETVSSIKVLGVSSGYSFLWLALLYLVGAYIKKYEPLKNLSSRICALGFVGSILITFLSRLLIEFLTWKATGTPNLGTKFITYTSPFMVLQALFALQLFSTMKLPKLIVKISAGLSPVSFGVFIIHTTTAVYKYILRDSLMFVVDYSLPMIIAISFLAIVIVFLICVVIDLVRIYLFKLCRVNILSAYIGNKIEKVFVRK